jgi:hypothetical protein
LGVPKHESARFTPFQTPVLTSKIKKFNHL